MRAVLLPTPPPRYRDGFSTLVMVTLDVMIGRAVGTSIGKRAELLGGVVLILIGSAVLYEHLSAAA